MSNGNMEWFLGALCVFVGVISILAETLANVSGEGPLWFVMGAVWFSISEIKGRRK
jgi:hypothetical protein